MKILRFTFIFLMLYTSLYAHELPCGLSSSYHGQPISDCSGLLLDETFSFTPEQVIDSLIAKKFIAISDVSNHHPEWLRKPHWLVFRLVQTKADSLSVLIKFSDLRGVWTLNGDKLSPIEYTGYVPQYSVSGITIFPEIHRFLFKLPKSDTITFLCKTFPKYHERGPSNPYVYNPGMYEQKIQSQISKETLLNGVVFGMMIMFFITSLIVFFLQREKAFLAYAIYIFLVFIYLWRDFEYLNFYFFSTMKLVPWHQTKLIITTILGISYIYFIRNILNTYVDHPKVDKMMSILLLLLIIAIPVDYIGSEILDLWSYRLAMYFVGIIILANQIFMNVYFFRTKDSISRYVALGSLFLAIGGISIPLFPVEIHTWIVRSCFIIEMFLFTAALSVKARRVMRQKSKIEEDLKNSELAHLYEMNTKVAVEKALTAENLRHEIARDIHDEVGAALTKISLSSHLISTSIPDQVNRSKIAKLGIDATKANNQLKELLFSINPSYDHFDVIQSYFRQFTMEYWESSDMILDFDMKPSTINPKMDRYVKSQLLMVFKEIQQNIAKHASALHIHISMQMYTESDYIIKVKDDGIGFDTNQTNMFSNGLKNMKERCIKIGADLSIVSSPGNGTEVRITGPLVGFK